jgi:hypothetical protein
MNLNGKRLTYRQVGEGAHAQAEGPARSGERTALARRWIPSNLSAERVGLTSFSCLERLAATDGHWSPEKGGKDHENSSHWT